MRDALSKAGTKKYKQKLVCYTLAALSDHFLLRDNGCL
jgi:hypothetical protein